MHLANIGIADGLVHLRMCPDHQTLIDKQGIHTYGYLHTEAG